MFKDDYRKKYDAVTPDPAFRRSLEERIEIMKTRRNLGWMPRTAVVVLAAMLALTTVGFASGAFRSIFGEMKSMFAGRPTVDYEHMEDISERGIHSQVVSFENGSQLEVKLEQSYYNGEQMALGWSAEPSGVNAEFFEKGDARAEKCEPVDGIADLEEHIGEENAAEFMRRAAADGWAAVAWTDCYLSDHVYLADIPAVMGDDGHEHAPDEALLYPEVDCRWNEDGVELLYAEYENPLPEAARNQDSLKLGRKASSQMCWLIVDGDQIFMGREPAERVEMVFEIHRSEEYAEKVYHVEHAFERFGAEFDLKLTPIRAEFSVQNQVSDEWKSVWAEYGGYLEAPLNLEADVIFDYEIRVDGAQVHVAEEAYEGVEGFSGWFLLPEGAQRVTFRPVYANSGAHADEDVTIELK